jgi:hypothetical protein
MIIIEELAAENIIFISSGYISENYHSFLFAKQYNLPSLVWSYFGK